jgi:hypothetical protein
MKIRILTKIDIPTWIKLSMEYDKYVLELVPDLTEWYEGNNNDSQSFKAYMDRKIYQKEAFMAIDNYNNCLGIIALSYSNNRITFYGISHNADLNNTGKILLNYAVNQLDQNKSIYMNEISSNSEWIEQNKKIIEEIGFVKSGNTWKMVFLLKYLRKNQEN